MTSGILERLKQETSPYHEQIERNPYAKAIMNQTLTLDAYNRYLQKFYGFHKPFEAQLDAHSALTDVGFDLKLRSKTPLLEQDLRHLGLDQETLNALPLADRLPDLSTTARALGSLYVLEGSTLGGQMITKLLAKHLPVTPEAGLTYFNAYGVDTRTRWAEFCGILQTAAVSEEDSRQMTETAKDTFRLLDEWLNRDSQ